MDPQKSILSRDFIILCGVNFLFFAAFYMLIPVLPLYLLNDLQAGKSLTGILLSLYVLAALASRPFAGRLVDSYPRKAVFVIGAVFYVATFCGYLWVSTFALFGLLRVLHGLAFGLVNTSTTTLAVDTIPQSRLGSGMGIFGITAAVPMALGPMLGLILYERGGAQLVFYAALSAAGAGAVLGSLVQTIKDVPGAPASGAGLLSKLLLPGVGKTALGIACIGFIYGLILNFITVYAQERGLNVNTGYFFGLLAVGMITSRLFAGRLIDNGRMNLVIYSGQAAYLLGLVLLATVRSEALFFGSALLLGLATGLLIPAFQTMVISMASPSQRGLANSSFFIAWDGGIGLALFSGGFIAHMTSFQMLYLISAPLVLLAAGLYSDKRNLKQKSSLLSNPDKPECLSRRD